MVCGWVGYVVYAEMAASHSLDSRLHNAQEQNALLKRQISERREEIAAAQTREWLIEEARKLGYVLPGERVYVITTPGAPLPPDGGIDLKSLPAYSVTPGPGGSPAPTQQPVIGPSGGATPTPFVLNLGH